MKLIDVEIDNNRSDELSKHAHAKARELHEYKIVREKIEKLEISMEDFYMNPYPFQKYLDSVSKCIACMSLSVCGHKMEGYYLDLVFDADYDYVYKPCKHKATNNDETAHISNYLYCSMPISNYTVNLDNLDLKDAKKSYIKLIDTIKYWLDNPTNKGLYLCGDVGVGKTYLASAVCNHFAKQNKKVAFVYLADWIRTIKHSIGKKEDYSREISLLQTVEFLIIDDIGAESITAWVRDELLLPIFNYRMENNKCTWFTSNETQETLKERYRSINANEVDDIKAERIMERIVCLSQEVIVDGKNKRKK